MPALQETERTEAHVTAHLHLPHALDELLVVESIEVVRTVDAARLATTLRWIVDQLHGKGNLTDLVALRRDNADLRAQLDDLRFRQDAADALQVKMQQLAEAKAAERLAQVDGQELNLVGQAPRAAGISNVPRSASQLVADKSDAWKEDTDEAAQVLVFPPASSTITDELLRRLLELQEDLTLKLAAKADADEISDLRRGLVTRCGVAELEQLAARCAEKADRSELDELLKLLSGGGGGGGSGGPSRDLVPGEFNSEDAQQQDEEQARTKLASSAADTGQEAASAPDLAAVAEQGRRTAGELQSIRGLLAVLQQRLQGKAESVALEDLRSVTAGLRAGLGLMEAEVLPALPKISVRLAATDSDILDLQQLLASASNELVAGRPSALKATEPSAAVLHDMKRRVEALEARAHAAAAALAGLPALQAARAMEAQGGQGIEDLQPALTEMYAMLAGKADTSTVEELSLKIDSLAEALGTRSGSDLEDLADKVEHKADMEEVEALEHMVRSLQQQLDAVGGPSKGGVDINSLDVSVKKLQSNKADMAALDALAERLAEKADAEKAAAEVLDQLNRASRAAVEELVLKVALLAPGGGADGVSSDGTASLLAAVKALVADKASRYEVDGCKAMLAQKASREELNMLHAQMSDKVSAADLDSSLHSSKASLAAVTALSQRLAALTSDVAGLVADRRTSGAPVSPSMASGTLQPLDGLLGAGASSMALSAGDTDDILQMISALARELQGIKDNMDIVAHAANVLAVGQDSAPAPSAMGTLPGGLEGEASSTSFTTPRGSPVRGAVGVTGAASGPREPRGSLGGVTRLVQLLAGGALCYKMNAFDPHILHTMAQKMSVLEAAVRNPAYAARLAQSSAPDMGMRDLEARVKRMAGDMKAMRDHMPTGHTAVDAGDHAILAAKPVGGYRCMACDRPLDKLDDAPGKYVANRKLPVMVPAATDAASKQAVGQAKQAWQERPSANGGPTTLKKTFAADAMANNGPQNWYGDGKGAAAMDLPREDVGPHLPKGGWRAGPPPALDGTGSVRDAGGHRESHAGGLPDISRGGSSPRPMPLSPARTNRISDSGVMSPAGATLPLISST